MKIFNELTNEEKLHISDDDLLTAVKLQAVELGYNLPITLPEIMQKHQFVITKIPQDSVKFWTIVAPSQYGGQDITGVSYRTEEEAWQAITNAIQIHTDYNKVAKIINGTFTVQPIFVTTTPQVTFQEHIAVYEPDIADYKALLEKCTQEVANIRRIDYDIKVIKLKMQNYIALAEGNLEIAKNFWNKVEKIEWPNYEVSD